MKKIYLACPYNCESEKIRIQRYEDSILATSILIKQKKYIVFSPITHSHPVAIRYGLPLGYDFWEQFDTVFLEWSNELFVLCIDGWNRSGGIGKEIEMMKKLNKSVRYFMFSNNKKELIETTDNMDWLFV